MKNLWMLFLLMFTFALVGCEQEQLPEISEDVQGEVTAIPSTEESEVVSDGNNQNNQDEEDHQNNNDMNQNQSDETVLKASVMVSNTAMSMRLGETQALVISVVADADFAGDDISISVDRGGLAGMDPNGTYVRTDLAATTISGLAAGSSQNVMLNLETLTMAPSFNAQELKIKISQGELEKETSFMLEVIPEIYVDIISAQQTPYTYNRTAQNTCLRPHGGQGVQVVFRNRTNDFASGSEPCIHTDTPLNHCNTGTRMPNMTGEYRPRRVPANQNPNDLNAQFYDHFNGQDRNGRRIHFNVAPGMEGNVCPN